MSCDNEFVVDQQRRISTICREFDSTEKHFSYILGEVQLLEEFLPDGARKTALIKKLVSDALQLFNKNNNHKSDVRMLLLWKILGKYSVEMKMEGVMERLNGLGYFRTTPEFYVVWAEHWAQQKNLARVNELIEKCLEHCKCDNAADLFRPLLEKYFGNVNEITALNKPASKTKPTETLKRRINSLQQPLARVLEVEEKSSIGNNTTTGNDHVSSNMVESTRNKVLEEKTGHTPKTPNSFTTNMYKNAYEVFAQTLPIDQNGCIQPEFDSNIAVFTQATKLTSVTNEEKNVASTKEGFFVYCDETTQYNKATNQQKPYYGDIVSEEKNAQKSSKEFSVYCDETSVVNKRGAEPTENIKKLTFDDKGDQSLTKTQTNNGEIQKIIQPSRIPSPMLLRVEKDSPFAKRMRRVELSFNEDSLLGDSQLDSPKRPLPSVSEPKLPVLKKNTPELLFGGTVDDDMTVAGAHGKFAHSQATSTPRRSMAPGLTLFSPNEKFSFSENISPANNSIFALAKALDTNDDRFLQQQPQSYNNNYGTSLQRRLSMAPSRDSDNLTTLRQNEGSKLLKPKQCKASDLVDALPRLHIKTPVPEESLKSVDDENEGEEKENQIVDSPAKETSFLKQQRHQKQVLQDENVVQKECLVPNICTNPWDEQERDKVLKHLMSNIIQCHEFKNQICSKVEVGRKMDFGGEYFNVLKLLGEGGFAKVYRAVNDENKSYAIKYEQPACPWEVYICDALQRRLSPKFLDFIMYVRDAYIFSNCSIIIYDYYPCGTLLDLSNHYKKEGMEMGGLLITFFGIQLGRILEQVHAAKIIHADVKPDNIVISAAILSDGYSVKDLLYTPAIKLIDWGRSIEMFYEPQREFIGRAGTKCFDCMEMISNRPWNYQTDFFGFVATIHVLMFNEYLVTMRENGKFRPVKHLKRRFALRTMWLDIFEKFLNIPDCKSIPSWTAVNDLMEALFIKEVDTQQQEWKKTVERYNGCVKVISNA